MVRFNCEQWVAAQIAALLIMGFPEFVVSCATGRYQHYQGFSSECRDCPSGYYQNQNRQRTCINCPSGYYQNQNRKANCIPCQFSGENIFQQCSYNCESGKYGHVYSHNSVQCRDCPSGYYQNQNRQPTCIHCPSGYYQNQNRKANCIHCPSGYYQNQNRKAYCIRCPSGYYQKQNLGKATSCKKCIAGKFSSSKGSTDCILCPAGRFVEEEKATQCNACPKGYFISRESERVDLHNERSDCQPCEPQTYSDEKGSEKCYLCATASQKASTSCQLCNAGKYKLNGTKRLSNDTQCRECPVGWFSSTAGQMKCDQCVPGTYASANNSKECSLCGRGRYGNTTGAVHHDLSCHNCSAGKYNEYERGSGETACKPCPRGYWSDKTGSESSGVCISCSAGRYGLHLSANSEDQCERCKEGKYSESIGQSDPSVACLSCPRGYAQDMTGKTFCLPCMPGLFQDKEQQALCQVCHAGRYQVEEQSTGCNICPQGWYSDINSSTWCKQCQAGQFQSLSEQVSCNACPLGMYGDHLHDNKTYCAECPSGYSQSTQGGTLCFECLPGFFSEANMSLTCAECPKGWFQNGPGQSACAKPFLGHIVLGGVMQMQVAKGWQMLCENSSKGVVYCHDSAPCPKGRYGESPPSNKCLPCMAGRTSSSGSLSCIECEKGKFANYSSSDACWPCNQSQGMYSDELGAKNCKSCSRGEMSVGHDCVTIAADTSLPVPTDVTVVMIGSQDEIFSALNGAKRAGSQAANQFLLSVLVKWRLVNNRSEHKNSHFNAFEIQLEHSKSTVKETHISFENTTAQLGHIYSLPVSVKVPIFRESITVVVRTLNTFRGSSWGRWSAPSQPWLSVDSGKCSDSQEYLDCSYPDPLQWKCIPCPSGAYCEGSIVWQDIKAKHHYWRDDRETNISSVLFVPPKYKFVPCPKDIACLGSTSNESCNEKFGYLNICDNSTGAKCRLCHTCKNGYSKGADGISCFKCPQLEEQAWSILLGLLVLLLLLCIVALLVFLKIKSSTKSHEMKRKAVHSTIKRILLSHLQLTSLCISLNVPWPNLVVDIMVAFSSMSSVSQYVSSAGCFFENDGSDPAGRNARFLYMTTAVVLLSPLAFIIATWVYWMYLVPTAAGRILACGLQSSMTFSDPTPNICITVRHRVAKHSSSSNRDESKSEHVQYKRALPSLDGITLGRNPREQPIATVKTRDAWSYTNVLFLYMMYPSLCRISFSVMSCRKLHMGISTEDSDKWSSLEYLRLDMEESCWTGRHEAMVFLLGVPGVLCYAIGAPLIAFAILYRHRSELSTHKYLFRLGLLFSGYRPTMWWYEGVVTARKLCLILLTAFFHDEALQLQFTIGMLIMAYAVHHTLMPFIPTAGTELSEGQHIADQTMLHYLERSSILICMGLVWSASVFIFYTDTVGSTCESAGCRILALLNFILNIGFLLLGVGLFTRHFLKRSSVLKRLSSFQMTWPLSREKTRASKDFYDPSTKHVMNPLHVSEKADC